MSELDKMIASLSSIVKPKNNIVEYEVSNLSEANTSYAKHIDDEPIWTAKVNRVYSKFAQKAEDAKLTDHFCTVAHSQTDSATKRSLVSAVARFTQQHSILQAYS